MLLGESLLTPTKIKQLLPLIKSERVFPENFGVNINSNSWGLSEVFKWLASNGNISSGIYIFTVIYMCVYDYYIYILI